MSADPQTPLFDLRIKFSDDIVKFFHSWQRNIPSESGHDAFLQFDPHARKVSERWKPLTPLGPLGFSSLWHTRALLSNQDVIMKVIPCSSVVCHLFIRFLPSFFSNQPQTFFFF